MIGELIGEAAGGIIRFLGWVLGDVVFEIAIRGVGYLICRPFNHDVDPDGFAAGFVGLLFLVAVAGAGYVVHAHWSG